MSDEIRVPQVADAQPGKVARLKVSTRESSSTKAALNVRLSLPRKQMVVTNLEGSNVLFGGGQSTVVSQFQMGLN